MAKKRPNLEEILKHTRIEGPRVVLDMHIRLLVEDAEFLAETLKKEGMQIEPYDFPRTCGIWQAQRADGVPYKRLAAKKLLQVLAARRNVDYMTFEGFKALLEDLTNDNFQQVPINDWGTTLTGMLSGYEGSHSAAVLDLINSDDEFAQIREHNLQAYDFSGSPKNTWKDKKGKPTDTSRAATKQFIKVLAEHQGVDYRTFKGFKTLLKYLTAESFKNFPINEWETTLEGVLNAYERSPSAAILDLVQSDDDFVEVRAHNLQAYDFPGAPKNTWKDKNDEPTDIARAVTKRLINVLAQRKGVDYKTFEGFKAILEDLIQDNFHEVPINDWGTTLAGMLSSAYKDSPSAAILDLVHSDDDFAQIREHNLQPYDFPMAPKNIWIDKKGKPTDIARAATKQFIKVLAEHQGVDYRTFKGFKTLLKYLTAESFKNFPINEWETTLEGVLHTYEDSPSAAISDLIKRDPEFKKLRGKITSDVLRGQTKTRESRLKGNYSSKVLRNVLSEHGVDLSDYGFVTFAKGEKQSIRDLLAEEAREHFGDRAIAYFGLEGPAFGSYFALAQKLKIDAKKSLIPEKNRRNYNVMNRIKRINKIREILNGNAPSGLELSLGTAEKALVRTDKMFDLVFLDWLGHLSPRGIRELDLAYKHLTNRGMIACTVNMSGMSQRRYHDQTGLSESPDTFMHNWARERGMSSVDIGYVGGDKVKTPMKLYIFK